MPGKDMISLILDSFKVNGPNGAHVCYVTRPAKMGLSDAKDGPYIRHFQLEVARALVAQLATAVEYLHTQGLAHCDIHYGNILIQLPSEFDQFSDEKLYEEYGEPEFEVVNSVRWQKASSIFPIPRHSTNLAWRSE